MIMSRTSADAAGRKDDVALPVIVFRNVSFSYGSVPVLENVTFAVSKGDSVCIVGPNGGGKTTLLMLVLGLLQPQSGEIRVFGDRPERARQRIGYTPQYVHYDPKFPVTVMEIVLMGRLGRRFVGPYSRNDKEVARRALAEVGMSDMGSRLFGRLSGGQRQRVLIARALACEPDVLLLDEPTANVDLAVGIRLQEILQGLSRRMTLLMVTHDLAFVSGLTTSVLCVNRRVISHATGELSESILREMYGDDIRLVRHDTGHAQQEGSHV